MFFQLRLLYKELNTFNRIDLHEMCLIIVRKVSCMGPKIVIRFTEFPTANTQRLRYYVIQSESSVGRCQVAGDCHCMVSERLSDCSSAPVVLDTSGC